MKPFQALVLSTLTVLATISAVHAGTVARLHTIQTNQFVTLPELAAACREDEQAAAAKAAEISERLAPHVENALTVRGMFYQSPSNPQPGQPAQPVESSCVLEFRAKAPLSVDARLLARRTRLSSGQWDSACAPAYEEASRNPNVPVALYWKSWTLVQGRICEVTAVEAKAAQ